MWDPSSRVRASRVIELVKLRVGDTAQVLCCQMFVQGRVRVNGMEYVIESNADDQALEFVVRLFCK